MNIVSIDGLVKKAQEQNLTISQLVLREQAEELELPQQAVYDRMANQFHVMMASVAEGQKPGIVSTSGLTGGNAYKLKEDIKTRTPLGGPFFASLLMNAMAVSELNGAMGKIVATPTGGSCGILPAALRTMMDYKGVSEKEAIMSLFTAAGVGLVIARIASVSGAEGGCQAECGSASAMAAAVMVELSGGTPEQISHSVAIALKNVLGLVCDPVAGLVEIPCTKRNAGGIANALCAAELALAQITSHIPADEVIVAMKQIGDDMPAALRETGEGGLAATPTGRRLCEQVFGHEPPL